MIQFTRFSNQLNKPKPESGFVREYGRFIWVAPSKIIGVSTVTQEQLVWRDDQKYGDGCDHSQIVEVTVIDVGVGNEDFASYWVAESVQQVLERLREAGV